MSSRGYGGLFKGRSENIAREAAIDGLYVVRAKITGQDFPPLATRRALQRPQPGGKRLSQHQDRGSQSAPHRHAHRLDGIENVHAGPAQIVDACSRSPRCQAREPPIPHIMPILCRILTNIFD